MSERLSTALSVVFGHRTAAHLQNTASVTAEHEAGEIAQFSAFPGCCVGAGSAVGGEMGIQLQGARLRVAEVGEMGTSSLFVVGLSFVFFLAIISCAMMYGNHGSCF